MDPDMQVFDAILTGIHVCESKGVFWLFIAPYFPHGSHGPWKSIMSLKSLWKLKNCGISLKSPWIFHRSPSIFLKAPWIKITLSLKKLFCTKEWLKAQQYTNCFGDNESVFSWFRCSRHSSFFRYLKYPRNRALVKEGIAISKPPSTYGF